MFFVGLMGGCVVFSELGIRQVFVHLLRARAVLQDILPSSLVFNNRPPEPLCFLWALCRSAAVVFVNRPKPVSAVAL